MASRPHQIRVLFPLGGQNRRGGYAQKTEPYSTPRALNVRGVGPLEKRGRGGVRPGLSKLVDNDFGDTIRALSSLTYIDGDGDRQQHIVVVCDGSFYIVDGTSITESLATIEGDDVGAWTDDGDDPWIFDSTVASTAPFGESMAFQLAQWNGKLFLADVTLKRYDPVGHQVDEIAGSPQNMPLICIFKERVILAGADHMWYASGQTDPYDWDFGKELGDVSRAVAGYVGHSGVIGEKILCLHNYQDDALIFGCRDSIWAIYGNPTENRKVNVSPHSGIIAPRALAVTPDGLVIFLTRRGLYTWTVGSTSDPAPFSKYVVPEELLAIDTSTTEVLMQYDHRNRGVHLFLTPTEGEGTHWWIDLEYRALWPEKYPVDQQPIVSGVITTDGYSDVVFGCKDGYIRQFDDQAATDDGTQITSELLLGPFHVSRAEGVDGQVAEMVAAFAAGSGEVTWKLVMGKSAEEAVDAAEAALDGDGLSGVDKIGDWQAGQNKVVYPRSRGPWAVLWLSSKEQWSYEAISMFNRRLGRLR